MTNQIINSILSNGIIAICRGVYGDDLLNLATALQEGGIRLMEVTFDQADANCLKRTPEAIAALKKACPKMDIGAGTVLTKEQVKATKDAGGRFIISPNTDPEIIRYTKELGLVSIPGAMTPSEILTAHQAGADFVKLFPAGDLGIGYIKSITSPINHVRILATGGVSLDTFPDFLKVGCCGAGVGSPLCKKSLIAEGDWAALQELARQYCACFAAHKKG